MAAHDAVLGKAHAIVAPVPRCGGASGRRAATIVSGPGQKALSRPPRRRRELHQRLGGSQVSDEHRDAAVIRALLQLEQPLHRSRVGCVGGKPVGVSVGTAATPHRRSSSRCHGGRPRLFPRVCRFASRDRGSRATAEHRSTSADGPTGHDLSLGPGNQHPVIDHQIQGGGIPTSPPRHCSGSPDRRRCSAWNRAAARVVAGWSSTRSNSAGPTPAAASTIRRHRLRATPSRRRKPDDASPL